MSADLFPDFSRLEPNRWEEGRAFRVRVESRGVGVQERKVEFNAAGWDMARRSPTFEDDYRRGVAKLLVQIALKLHS